ncbi:MAG: hypothetical protein ACRCZF_02555 [Gemmataceae bacterium]
MMNVLRLVGILGLLIIGEARIYANCRCETPRPVEPTKESLRDDMLVKMIWGTALVGIVGVGVKRLMKDNAEALQPRRKELWDRGF